MGGRGALREPPLAEELSTVDGSWWWEKSHFSLGLCLLMMAAYAPVHGPVPITIWATLMGLMGYLNKNKEGRKDGKLEGRYAGIA